MTLQRPAPFDLVVDTSAIMALLLGESTAEVVTGALRASRAPVISAPTVLELSMVASTRLSGDTPDTGAIAARGILDAADVLTIDIGQQLVDVAFDGWLKFGKGRHPAALNFGDCFSYALAREYELPLLCVGAGFARTDLPALVP